MAAGLCKVDRSPLAAQINKWLGEKVPKSEIERRLADLDIPITRETLWKHEKNCLMPLVVAARVDQMAALEKTQRQYVRANPALPKRRDVLEQVVETVAAGLEAGELVPTISEGIKADTALRSLQERGADRDLMLRIAAVLGGAIPVIGSYKDVTPEALEDAEEFRQLTAG